MTVRRIGIIGGVVGGAIGGATSALIGLPTPVCLLLAAAVPVTIAPQLWTSAALWAQGTLRVAASSALAGLVRLVAIPLLAMLGLLSLDAAFALQAFVVLFVSVALLYPLMRELPNGPGNRTLRDALVAGAPVVGFGLLTAVTLRADLITLQLFSDSQQVGVYAAVVAVTQAALAISTFFRNRAQAGIASGRSGMAVWRYPLALSGLAALGILAAQILAEPLSDLLFGPAYEGAAGVMRILAVAAAMQMLLDVGQGMLIASGRRRALLSVAIVGAVVTILSLALLVPTAGAMGAAVAATVGSGASAGTALALQIRGR